MNCQVDIMIVGDSRSGHDLLDKIASSKPTIKVAFISKDFKSFTTHDYLNVEYFRDEVIFTDYKNRLFGCYLKNGTRIYGTHLIIATGLAYSPFTLNNKPVAGVFNNADDIPKTAKTQPAVVICNNNADVKLGLEVAKKYKQVYMCTEASTLEDMTSVTTRKLEKTENIVMLPNTTVIKAIAKDGVLQKVELDNYSTLNCSAIFVRTSATPDVAFVSEKLIQKNDQGYIVTTDNLESALVPKCFAIGSCTVKCTKTMEQALINTVLQDF
jgi:thioredoxin reductase